MGTLQALTGIDVSLVSKKLLIPGQCPVRVPGPRAFTYRMIVAGHSPGFIQNKAEKQAALREVILVLTQEYSGCEISFNATPIAGNDDFHRRRLLSRLSAAILEDFIDLNFLTSTQRFLQSHSESARGRNGICRSGVEEQQDVSIAYIVDLYVCRAGGRRGRSGCS